MFVKFSKIASILNEINHNSLNSALIQFCLIIKRSAKNIVRKRVLLSHEKFILDTILRYISKYIVHILIMTWTE